MNNKRIIFEAQMKTIGLESESYIIAFADEILPLFEARTISLEQKLSIKEIETLFKLVTSSSSIKGKATSAVKKEFSSTKSIISKDSINRIKSKAHMHINLLPEKQILQHYFDKFVGVCNTETAEKWLAAISGAILTVSVTDPNSTDIIKDIIKTGIQNVIKSKPKHPRIEPKFGAGGV